jgi:hypothetical protein
MIRRATTIIAITSKIWINPPIVYDVTNPNSQSAIIITAIVYNISDLLFNGSSMLTLFLLSLGTGDFLHRQVIRHSAEKLFRLHNIIL